MKHFLVCEDPIVLNKLIDASKGLDYVCVVSPLQDKSVSLLCENVKENIVIVNHVYQNAGDCVMSVKGYWDVVLYTFNETSEQFKRRSSSLLGYRGCFTPDTNETIDEFVKDVLKICSQFN